MILTVVSAVIVLGVLIFVHELGHFLVAKRCGVGVTVFSLGFGPAIFSFNKGETNYRISLIPLGGYVRMVGEDPGEELPPEDVARSFNHKPVGQRLAVVAAGPLFNVLFAVIVFYLVIVCAGLPQMATVVGEAVEGKPAALAGVQKDDVILAIDGQPVTLWQEMVEKLQSSQGRPMQVLLERAGQELELSITPSLENAKNQFGEDVKVYQLGIINSAKGIYVRQVSFLEGVPLALEKTWEAGTLIFVSVAKLITGNIALDTMGGPIKIAQVAGEAARYGLAALATLAALLSVNLAILNLLPIPALDGGHLLFFSVEAVTRRKPSLRFRERAQQVGVLLLLALMVFVFYNDIASLVKGG